MVGKDIVCSLKSRVLMDISGKGKTWKTKRQWEGVSQVSLGCHKGNLLPRWFANSISVFFFFLPPLEGACMFLMKMESRLPETAWWHFDDLLWHGVCVWIYIWMKPKARVSQWPFINPLHATVPNGECGKRQGRILKKIWKKDRMETVGVFKSLSWLDLMDVNKMEELKEFHFFNFHQPACLTKV